MRILHFYKTSYPDSMGGVEQVVHQMAFGAAIQGVQVDVLSLTSSQDYSVIDIDGYRVHRVPLDFQIASTSFSYAAFAKFRELASRADIIHYHYPWPFMDLVHFLCLINKPNLVSYHSDIVRQRIWQKLYSPLKKIFLKQTDAIVSSSPNYMASSKVIQKYKTKTSVIPYGIYESLTSQADESLINKWKDLVPAKFFLFVGVHRYYKGLNFLIEAAKELDYPIFICGSGPLEKSLKKLVTKLNVRHIHFLGFVTNEDKNALMQLCYAIVFPSYLRAEAFGLSLLEAAMHGKAMISCEIETGTSYVNLDGVTGLVVPPRDPESLKEAMITFWNNPDKVKAMGSEARKRYLTHFTGELMMSNYMRLYNELLNTKV